MVKNVRDIHERRAEITNLGKVGNTTLSDIAITWGCTTENIACYLHRLQEQENYAYLIDGNGYFRIFKDFS